MKLKSIPRGAPLGTPWPCAAMPGGAMAAVQKNMALLPAADREAIAAYLKAIPASK